MSEKIILSLGSNIGDRGDNINNALSALSNAGFDIEKISSFYETEPMGYKDQDEFLNIAVSGRFYGEPGELLGVLRTVEMTLGRKRKLKYGPRTIDIDIIMFGGRKVNSVELVIPHAEYRNRLFVLVPAAEIEPDVVDSSCGKRISTILSECKDRSKVKKTECKK